MRILYDGFIYSNQAVGGINRYFTNLINRLPQDFQPVITNSGFNTLNFPSHPNLKMINFKKLPSESISSKLEKIYFYGALALKGSFNLQHPTYYAMLTPNKYNPVKSPKIVTVHDMIHELYAKNMDPSSYQTSIKRRAIQSATKIICVSENTKRDLIDLYSVEEKKITVIYEASEINITDSYGQEQIPNRPYFLYIGRREADYKNFYGLLKTWATISNTQPDICLCVVGAAFTPGEMKTIYEYKLSDKIINYGYVTDKHLAKLYRHSLAFVYPSLYEGFGIPPLEAMACGGLVVTSNRASIPEVVGDAAILFDPDSKDELPFILEQIAKGFAGREEFLAKGLNRANLFSWDKTASQTVDLYRTLSK